MRTSIGVSVCVCVRMCLCMCGYTVLLAAVGFHIVVCGLDSILARRWLNGMLVSLLGYHDNGQVDQATIVPMVDGGTEGDSLTHSILTHSVPLHSHSIPPHSHSIIPHSLQPLSLSLHHPSL